MLLPKVPLYEQKGGNLSQRYRSESIKGLEIHDRLIVATSINTNSTIVSKDTMIKDKGFKVLW